MNWKELEKELIDRVGPAYSNYPRSVDWNLQIMRFEEEMQELYGR